MTKWHTMWLGVGIVGCWVGAIAVGLHSQPVSAPVAHPSPAAKSTPMPTPALDPMSIAAIRARAYSGSPITTLENLGEQGGYRNAIVTYQSDGLTIRALMSTPDGAKPVGGWPVVILGHGYINPAVYQTNGPEYRGFIAALAKAGYLVIKPDYRGHGLSQGTPEGGHFSPVYAYDLLNLIASIKQYPDANPGRIGLLAHSMSGHTALRAIVSTSDIKATVLMAGVVGSFDDIFYNWSHSPVANDLPAIVQTDRQNLIAAHGEPRQNPQYWAEASAINYVRNVTGAVQVDQSAGDSIVPKIFSDHLVSALQQAGKPVEYNLYPGNDHQFSLNRTALLQHILNFYKTHL